MVYSDRKDPVDKHSPHQYHVFMRPLLLSLLGLGIILSLLGLQPSASIAAAQGTVQITGRGENLEVVFSRASSDDPPHHQDPGQELDVAECRLSLEQGKLAKVTISGGYPGYTCTLQVTVHNRSGQAVRLQETEVSASAGLEVVRVDNPDTAIIPAGKKSEGAFQIRIQEDAAELRQLEFQILQIYTPAEAGP